MKNRVLLTMLIVFIVLTGVCITCGTIFVIREVEVEDRTVQTDEALDKSEKKEIIQQCGLLGKNILFSINEENVTQKIKALDPTLKVQTVVAQFPNRVVLVVSRRVAVFYDGKHWYDAEMCVVDRPVGNGVDISGANLDLVDNLKTGDLAVPKDNRDRRTKCKIEQIKTIATYFDDLNDFKIAYNDSSAEAGAYRVCLSLKIKTDVTFKITVNYDQNFWNALAYADQIYREKANEVSGIYETVYQDNNGKLRVTVKDELGETKQDNGEDMDYEE